jgi:hypothetical protein
MYCTQSLLGCTQANIELNVIFLSLIIRSPQHNTELYVIVLNLVLGCTKNNI